MRIVILFMLCLLFIQLYACNGSSKTAQTNNMDTALNTATAKMKITIGSHIFTATLYNNATATAFKEKLPLTVRMTGLNGNEKYVDLPGHLPTHALNPGTIQTGDIMLYGSDTLVLFYKTFSTSYSYTPLGRIDDPYGLDAALGLGSPTVKFELA